MATKSELESATESYRMHLEQAVQFESQRSFRLALDQCELAWRYLADMMSYRRKYEDATFKSVSCIDMALRVAPFVLRASTLEVLEGVLKENRGIDKHASDDLAARALAARALLGQIHRLWDLLEREPGLRQDTLRQRLGGDQDQWRQYAEQLESMGLIERTPAANSYSLRIATNLSDRVSAKCPKCGAVISGPKRAFLTSQTCPACARSVVHVLVTDN